MVKAMNTFQRLAEEVNGRLANYDFDEVIRVTITNDFGLHQRFVFMVVPEDLNPVKKAFKVLDWGDFQSLYDGLSSISDGDYSIANLVPMVILSRKKTRLKRLSEKEAMFYML